MLDKTLFHTIQTIVKVKISAATAEEAAELTAAAQEVQFDPPAGSDLAALLEGDGPGGGGGSAGGSPSSPLAHGR